MQPLNFGSKKRPTPLEAKIIGNKGTVLATVTPKGPRLNLQPVLDRILVSSPDAGAGEINMIGGVMLPGNAVRSQFVANAQVKVVAVGPDVRTVKIDDEVLVPRAAVEQISHDGNQYWWINEAGVLGIVKGTA